MLIAAAGLCPVALLSQAVSAVPFQTFRVEPVDIPQLYEPLMFFYHRVYAPSCIQQAELFARKAAVSGWQWPRDTIFCQQKDLVQDFPCAVLDFNLGPQRDAEGELYYQVAGTMPRLPGPGSAYRANRLLKELVRPFLEKQYEPLPWVVFVFCIVELDGRLTHIRPYRLHDLPDSPLYDQFCEVAVQAVAKLPRFEPAQQANQPVRCAMIFEILFQK